MEIGPDTVVIADGESQQLMVEFTIPRSTYGKHRCEDLASFWQRELKELKAKLDRLDQEIKELDDAGQRRFESIQQDLSNTMEDGEKDLDEVTTKLEQDE